MATKKAGAKAAAIAAKGRKRPLPWPAAKRASENPPPWLLNLLPLNGDYDHIVRPIRAGAWARPNASPWDELFRGIGPAFEAHRTAIQRAKIEARKLLEWIEGAGVEEAEAYLAAHPPSAMCIALLLAQVRRQAISDMAADNAGKRNKTAREWVRQEWRARADKGQSKANFGQMYAPLVRIRFRVTITPQRISDYWLKGE